MDSKKCRQDYNAMQYIYINIYIYIYIYIHKPHDIASQKTNIFIVIAAITTDFS